MPASLEGRIIADDLVELNPPERAVCARSSAGMRKMRPITSLASWRPFCDNGPMVCCKARNPIYRAHAAALAVIFCAAAAWTQGVSETVLDGEIELPRLVDLAAERLDLNIEYDKAQLRGAMTFRLGSPLSDDELWALTNRLLSTRGFTTIRRPGEGTIGVVPLSEAAGLARIEGPGGSVEEAWSSGFRVVAMEIEHAPPDQVVSTLRAFSSAKAGSVSRVAETDVVILADLTPRVEQMLGLLARLDTPDASVGLERVELESVSAAAIVTQLTQLVAKRQLAGAAKLRGEPMIGGSDRELFILAPASEVPAWRSYIKELDYAQGVETRTYRPRYFALGDVSALIGELLTAEQPSAMDEPIWRIVENTLTGSLVVTATPDQHARVEALLDELAAAPPESRQPIRSFVIRNRDAEDVRGLLEDLLHEGMLEDASDVPNSDGPAATGAPTARGAEYADRSRRLRLTVDEGTNTLIAAGEPRLLDEVQSLLDQIDVRRPQVMLEVLLVSLTEGQTLDLGVELQELVTDSGTLVALGSLFGLTDLSPFGGGGGVDSLPSPGGTAVVLNPGDFSAVVRALETINKGRSLSMPKVLVNDNESASIDSVVQEPFLSTNASDTVATTSFGGFESAGTTVSVTPQIAEGDHLSLQYTITLSSFTGESPDPSTPPPRQQNSISSIATIPDGYTIAVGGIELVTDAEAESRVPLLGSIPLLGELFKTTSTSGSRSRFFAFIRSDIMRHASFEDLKHASDPIREAAELDADDPVLAPRVIR